MNLKKINRKIQCLILLFVCVVLILPGCANRGQTVKNLIIMIGDGMGPVHEEAGRAEKCEPLAWDGFEYCFEATTDSLSGLTDSAAAATAIATGTKTYNGVICKGQDGKDLKTVTELAKSKKKAAGVITSDVLSGATPACFSAHSDGRGLENDIIESQLKSRIDLLMGQSTAAYDGYYGDFKKKGFTYCGSLAEAEKASGKIAGLFAGVPVKNNGLPGHETLRDMTVFALNRLSKNKRGFALMIEGAKIDHASHSNLYGQMIAELLAFDECVEIARDWAQAHGNTMVIVTADHETGGLKFSDGSYFFTSAGHTDSNASVYIQGWPREEPPFAEKIIDNTDIFKISRSVLGV